MGQGRMGQLANQRSPGMRLMNANDTHECEWDCRFFHWLSCPVLHLGLTDINGGPQYPAAGGRFNVKTNFPEQAAQPEPPDTSAVVTIKGLKKAVQSTNSVWCEGTSQWTAFRVYMFAMTSGSSYLFLK
ncbi:hypothetical protein BaRGS_00023993 [Batillaria attramentaria]|uniref:Uncharacterized protein n=1 Tax=Batillaria attramentaria TaxID=370345 RepID=A0ABD0KCF8_9CAEN